jgi:hypothetical protein
MTMYRIYGHIHVLSEWITAGEYRCTSVVTALYRASRQIRGVGVGVEVEVLSRETMRRVIWEDLSVRSREQGTCFITS